MNHPRCAERRHAETLTLAGGKQTNDHVCAVPRNTGVEDTGNLPAALGRYVSA